MSNRHQSNNNDRKKRPRRAKFKKKQHPIPAKLVKSIKFAKGGYSIYHGGHHNNQQHIVTKKQAMERYLPENLKYMLLGNTPFSLNQIKKDKECASHGYIAIPRIFSIIDNPKESYLTLKRVLHALYVGCPSTLTFDYSFCEEIGLETQAVMDVILRENRHFCDCIKSLRVSEQFPEIIQGVHIDKQDIQKMMFTVGSPANLGIRELDFPDIIKCPMRIHSMNSKSSYVDICEQKEIDSTEMADYVINSLSKVGRTLTWEAKDSLCTVIGEILINAEEHSSTHNRISVGYFQDLNDDQTGHYGLFKLVILNFGQSIYEKFKSPMCPNKDIVKKMEALSNSYTSWGFFHTKEFDEENLWTLYSLQDGVTCVPDQQRGGGSIRFIENFFNLKGNKYKDDESKMILLSGGTQIIFDGTYGVITKTKNDGKKYSMMTFNRSGELNEKPDKNYVRKVENYFPGTVIVANIRISEDDIKQLHN